MELALSNHQCPGCNEYMYWDDKMVTSAFVLFCQPCNRYWEIDEGYDPDTYEELFYIYPYDGRGCDEVFNDGYRE